MSESTWTAVDRLRHGVETCLQGEIEQAEAIAELAAEHAWDEDATFDVVGTRPVRIGADGTALVDEFLPLEVAAAKGMSVGAATWLIRDIVNLQARHPVLWMMVRRGQVPVWQARQVVAEAARYQLTAEQAGEVDLQLAPKVGVLPWSRVLRLARGLIATIAADKVAAMAEQARAARYVRKHDTDDPTVGFIAARVDTADAIFFDATIDRIADILADRGDTDVKEVRRAKALGVLATPERARLMLTEAAEASTSSANDSASTPAGDRIRSTDPRLLPKATVYVHVAEETLLHGQGTCRVEGVGPLAVSMLKLLIGNCRITLTPVIRPYAEVAVDSYEIPDWMRKQVLLRDQIEVFPYSSRSARKQDLDHTVPYRPGVTGQTRASTLGPLSRKPHRGKTHGGWQVEQPKPGVFWWTSPTGHQYRVGPNGTHRYHQLTWHLDHDPEPDGEPPGDSS